MKRLTILILLALGTLFLGMPSSAFAKPWGHGGGHANFHHSDWHDHDHWHAGHWNHGWHHDHFGWWWIVDDLWYPYAAPVYPYPEPIVIEQSAPPVQVQPQAQMWYYCDKPAGYYPYVTDCRTAWRPVPASPPVAYGAVPPGPIRY